MASFTSSLVSFVVALLLLAPSAPAQPDASALARVTGRIVKPSSDSLRPVSNHWVTLHRVGTNAAGPLDSVRTSASGTYTFTFTRTGANNAIYFVSSSYDGIAYFTKPLHGPVTTGDDAEIVVFDTTSRPVPISVRGHHVIISTPAPNGERRVAEVFDLSNDSSVTSVAANETPAGAVWSSHLPTGAHDPSVKDGDIAAAAVRFVGSQVLVYAPLSPGIKQIVFSYALPDGAFPWAMPVQRPTGVLEILLEEPNATLRGNSIRQVRPVIVEGRQFQRYLGSDMPASAVATITVPHADPPINPWFVAGLTLIIGGAMTFALARAIHRR